MPDDDRDNGFKRSLKALQSLQSNAEAAGPAAGASYSLIGSILLLGGLGYAFDAWKGTAPSGLLWGLGLGIVTGFYQLVRAAWRR
jgi:F0F1-type ATP synthase assembly protein I